MKLGEEPDELIERAYRFAKDAHEAVGQRLKYTGEPYIVHPVAVAGVVATVWHTKAMIAAALLHDTVEDTHVSIELLRLEFGDEVADLVSWLTDISKAEDGNRAARKAIDRAHTANAPAQAKTIKLADVIVNSRSIVDRDLPFARVYIPEKLALLEVLKEGDAVLWQQAYKILQESALRINGEASRRSL